ncbi:MAG TPA: C2 family cysteine protease [Myxococcota bacterium]
MPVTLSDRSIRAAYKTLGKSITGNNKASLADLDKILADVADRSGLALTDAKTQLKQAVSTQEKLAIVKEGMSATEKADLTAILDGDVPLEAEAKRFLEQLVGRTPVNQPHGKGPVDISSMKLVGGKVEIAGSAAPNVTVEALNLSEIPTKRLFDDDTFVLGTTDADGKLSGKTDLKAGDWLRIRTRDKDGKTSDWMVVRADQLGKDTTGAAVALQRIELSFDSKGKVSVANNNNSRPISEPFAVMRFTNERTKAHTDITLDDTGRFPGVPKLEGKPGDTFSVAATDGRVNKDFTDKVGTLQTPGAVSGKSSDDLNIEDGKPHKDDRKPDGSSRYDLKHYTGPLFLDGASYTDVVQGNLGDCYTPAGAAALAAVRPDLFPQIIRVATPADRKLVNADRAKRHEPPLPDTGKFYVVEFQRDREGNHGKHLEPVDADFFTRNSGGPVYGTSSNSVEPGKMELWFPLFEKAWGQLNDTKYNGDGYNNIGNGGSSADLFEAVLGREARDEDFNASTKDRCFQIIKDNLAKKLPCCLATKDDKGHEALFANTGIYGDHTYTILDAYEKGGVKYLKLRNPWGESEPKGNGKDDGVFDMKLDDLPKWYSDLWTVR